MLRPEKWLLNDRGPNLLAIARPPLIPGIERVQEMVILDVTISDWIGFGAHMDKICCKTRKSMFGYVFWSPTVNVSLTLLGLLPLARLLYASSVWRGFATVEEHKRLNGIVRKLSRSGFLPDDVPGFDKHCSRAYSTRFRLILLKPCHVQFIHLIKSHFSQI